jgi:hypothetical protein
MAEAEAVQFTVPMVLLAGPAPDGYLADLVAASAAGGNAFHMELYILWLPALILVGNATLYTVVVSERVY